MSSRVDQRMRRGLKDFVGVDGFGRLIVAFGSNSAVWRCDVNSRYDGRVYGMAGLLAGVGVEVISGAQELGIILGHSQYDCVGHHWHEAIPYFIAACVCWRRHMLPSSRL